MIVETMSYEEICREFDKIHDKFFAQLQDRFNPGNHNTSKMYRYMLKHKAATNVLFKPITFEVDNNTTYYAIPIIPDFKFFKKNGPSAMTFLTYTNNHGLMALMRLGYRDNEYLFATRHFFDRFIERFLNDKVTKTEAICQFFANNTNFVMTDFPIASNPNNLIGLTDEVVFFGERIAPAIIFARTCITREMLHSGQFEATGLLDKGIELVLKDREKLKELFMKQSTNHFRQYSFI